MLGTQIRSGVPSKSRFRHVLLPALAAAAALAASCSGFPGATGSPEPKSPQKPAAPTSAPSAPGPGERSLSALSPETRDFLAELRSRIRRGDWAWAAGRADAAFLRTMEGRPRDANFYTYLFAAGALAEDSEGASGRWTALPISRVRDIAWDEVRIDGPVAEVRGRFLLSQGEPIPLALRVLWRLDPPCILGVQP